MNNSKLIFVLLFLLKSIFLFSQKNTVIDSLENLLSNEQLHDTLRINYSLKLVNEYQDIDFSKSKKKLKRIFTLLNETHYLEAYDYYYVLKCREKIYETQNDSATFYASKAQASALKSNDLEMYVYGAYYEAIVYLVQNKNSACIVKLKKLLTYLRNKEHFPVESDIYNTLATAYSRNYNFDLAIKTFSDAIKIARKNKDMLSVFTCYYEIALIYILQKNYDQALKYCNKSLALIQQDKIFNYRDYSRLLQTFGIIYSEQKQYDKAIATLEKAHRYYNLSGGDYDKWGIIHSLIETYIKAKKYQSAIQMSTEIIQKNKVVDANILIIYSYLAIANTKLKNNTHAVTFIEKIFKTLESNPNLNVPAETLLGFHENAALVYEENGVYNKAFFHTNQYKIIYEKLNEEINQHQINQLQEEFNTKENELEIKELKIEQQVKKIEREQLKNKQYFTILILYIVISLLVFTIFIYSKIKKKNSILEVHRKIIENKNIQLEKSKLNIAQSLQEKEILLKEIHHRIKNNLQLITSLLSIQAREGSYEDINDFVLKGQSKISSISLIHQSLYQSNDFKEVALQDYIENLVNAIKTLFENPNTKISFSVNANNNYLDIQSAMPLGLIINELISNALKHAFPNKLVGTIKIDILQENHNYKLLFSDDGIGLQKQKGKTLGLELVEMLVSQLHGSIVNVNTSKGTKFQIEFCDTINKNFKINNSKHLESA